MRPRRERGAEGPKRLNLEEVLALPTPQRLGQQEATDEDAAVKGIDEIAQGGKRPISEKMGLLQAGTD